ncbi:pyrimidine utilization protein D [Sphingomonas panacisoli]|uniref:Putative carbamate hydrolase RutD n=1 Tax=Sphingomonas panacisoli TaxID=1813879 RepID=A0A5B8LH43_9SPHN|nr:pyrimidine utilization protein D [Sphingomonas panacisoli]QDZ07597.1 pyrimidine utilization protein D [Sphingomonas panacisoli]
MAEAGGLYYEEHGRRDAPPLILSSGLGGSANYWAPNIPALAEHFRVIAYDQRGTGRSDRAPLASLSVEDMAADVVLLLDALDISRADLVGHALGGLIGLSLALSASERLGRLVVINGWGRLEKHTARCFDARLALLRNSGVEAFVRAQPIFLYPANWLTLDAPHLEDEEAASISHFPGVAVAEQRIAAVRAFDVQDRLGEIAHRVFIYSVGDDVLVPSIASDRLLDRLPDNGFPDNYMGQWGGHACNVTDPDTFNRIVLDFLRS